VKYDRPEMLRLLLEMGMDPDERVRVEDLEATEFSSGCRCGIAPSRASS
jgi:hypothetical protein